MLRLTIHVISDLSCPGNLLASGSGAVLGPGVLHRIHTSSVTRQAPGIRCRARGRRKGTNLNLRRTAATTKIEKCLICGSAIDDGKPQSLTKPRLYSGEQQPVGDVGDKLLFDSRVIQVAPHKRFPSLELVRLAYCRKGRARNGFQLPGTCSDFSPQSYFEPTAREILTREFLLELILRLFRCN
jgi:hypothetical protein